MKAYPDTFPARLVKGNLNLGPGSFMYAPAGFVGLSNAPGNIWFVDKANGNDAWDGTLPKRYRSTTMGPKATITAALAQAQNNDVILVGPGVYTEAAYPLTITQDNLKIFGVMTSGNQWGQPSLKITTPATTAIWVESPNIGPEIGFIGFHVDAATANGIQVGAHSNNAWRTHLHDCFFGGNGVASWGAILGNTVAAAVGDGTTDDAPCTILERCYFQDFMAGDVFFNCGYGSVVKDSVFEVNNPATLGIEYYTDSTSRPFAFILHNKFITPDNVNAYGVKVINTPSPGYLMIDDNHFVNFADAAHAISASGGGKPGLIGLNYLGVTPIPI